MYTKSLKCLEIENRFEKFKNKLEKSVFVNSNLDKIIYDISIKCDDNDLECYIKLLSLDDNSKILNLILKRIETHLIEYEYYSLDLLDIYSKLRSINSDMHEVFKFILENYNLSDSKKLVLVCSFLMTLSLDLRRDFDRLYVKLIGFNISAFYGRIYTFLGCENLYLYLGINEFVALHSKSKNLMFNFLTEEYYIYLLRRIPFKILEKYEFTYLDFKNIGISRIDVYLQQIKIFMTLHSYKDIELLKKGK